MPTYIVTTANIALSQEQKSGIASVITAAHNSQTGAPGYFAQVIFSEVGSGSHFIGGAPNNSPHVYILGLIRAGRSDEAKRRLVEQILTQTKDIARIKTEDMWVYIQDIAAGQMAEFGRFLPTPGAEGDWQRGMSSQKLAELTRAGVVLG
jgi:phenylpyruvate tautomerase PptA (4-oxalocrotonate tautomerase family)